MTLLAGHFLLCFGWMIVATTNLNDQFYCHEQSVGQAFKLGHDPINNFKPNPTGGNQDQFTQWPFRSPNWFIVALNFWSAGGAEPLLIWSPANFSRVHPNWLSHFYHQVAPNHFFFHHRRRCNGDVSNDVASGGAEPLSLPPKMKTMQAFYELLVDRKSEQ